MHSSTLQTQSFDGKLVQHSPHQPQSSLANSLSESPTPHAMVTSHVHTGRERERGEGKGRERTHSRQAQHSHGVRRHQRGSTDARSPLMVQDEGREKAEGGGGPTLALQLRPTRAGRHFVSFSHRQSLLTRARTFTFSLSLTNNPTH